MCTSGGEGGKGGKKKDFTSSHIEPSLGTSFSNCVQRGERGGGTAKETSKKKDKVSIRLPEKLEKKRGSIQQTKNLALFPSRIRIILFCKKKKKKTQDLRKRTGRILKI